MHLMANDTDLHVTGHASYRRQLKVLTPRDFFLSHCHISVGVLGKARGTRGNFWDEGGDVNGNKRIGGTLLFVIITSTVAFEGMALDYFLLQVGVRPFQLMLLSNVFMAAAAATALLERRRRRLEKQKALADRLEALSE